MEVLAYYLPQYHPIPENDEWWGAGFTEWTSATSGRPLFRGHQQPHLPSDLGFYDLRVPETRSAQADLAAAAGLTGFIYWHYWLGGRRLLERPFTEVLSSNDPDFPFCLAWANHSWQRRWGDPTRYGEMLLEQTYPGEDDDAAHFAELRRAFEDPRYVRIDGRPVLFVFSPGQLPDPARFVETWQERARDLGGLYLVAMLERSDYRNHVADGFDAAVGAAFADTVTDLGTKLRNGLINRRILKGPKRFAYPEHYDPAGLDTIEGTAFPVIAPNWDDTPRLGRRGTVATDCDPTRFAARLRGALTAAAALPIAEQVLIIKSWNEWGEGNYLEPDQEFCHGWLEALRSELDRGGHHTTKESP